MATSDQYTLYVFSKNGAISPQSLTTDQQNRITAQTGEQYRLTNGNGDLPDNVIAARAEHQLHLYLDNGVHLVIDNYYLTCADAHCGIDVGPGSNLGGFDASVEQIESGESLIVYTQGDISQVLLAHADTPDVQALIEALMSSPAPVYAEEDTEAEEDLGTESTESTEDSGSLLGLKSLLGLGLGLGALGLAAGSSGGSDDGSDGGSDEAPTTYDVNVSLGPILEGNTELSVLFYSADGTLLGESGTFNAETGTFVFEDSTNYSGILILRLLDTGDGVDYLDETTGLERDIQGSLLAIANVDADQGSISLNINPLTAIVAAILDIDGNDAESITQDQIDEANLDVAAAFQIEGSLQDQMPVLVIDAEGTAQPGNAYGEALALLSAYENDSHQTTQEVVEEVLANLDGSSLDENFTTTLIESVEDDDLKESLIEKFTPNQAPVFTSLAAATVDENQTVAYTAEATDADGDDLTYSLSGTDAALFSIDVNTGEVTFNTALDFENPTDSDRDNAYEVIVTASDGTSSTEQTVTITVDDLTEVGSSPVFTSLATATVNENQTVAYTAVATDADSDTLTYSLDPDSTDAGLFNIGASTGVVTFKTAPDFENPEDANNDNLYEITVIARDGDNATEQTVTITVDDIAREGNSPVFTSLATATAAENQTAAVTAVATDADSDPLTYGLIGTDAALFSIDADTGVVTFNTAPDFENPEDANNDNLYEITVTATDGINAPTEQTVTITVTNVNEAPVFTSLATATVDENQTVAYTAVATDADGDPLSYRLSGTDAALFSIDADTGVLTFNTAPNFENPTDSDMDNAYEVIVTASDDTSSTEQTLTITVDDITEIGSSPVFTSLATATAAENETAAYTAVATDADDDDDPLSYRLSGTDAALFSIDVNTGEVTFNTAPDFENATDFNQDNDYEITVTASDGTDAAEQTVIIAVTNVNDNAPVFNENTAEDLDTISENETDVFYTAEATDADGDDLTYSLSGTDAVQFSIDADTGDVTVSGAGGIDAGTYEITVTASDGDSGSLDATQNVSITVAAVLEIELSELDVADGFVIYGVDEYDRSGWSVSSAGDINGDGVDDLIIGAPLADTDPLGLFSGVSYVVFGTTNTIDAIELSEIENGGEGGFIIEGKDNYDNGGQSVSSAGDVNGDGFDDLIIGAPEAEVNSGDDDSNDDSNDDEGFSYVVFGTADGTDINLADVEDGTGGFVIYGEAKSFDNSGEAVSSAGDVNGDGLDDLIIGTYYGNVASSARGDGEEPNKAEESRGASYVVFGTTDGTAIELSDVETGSGGFVIYGVDDYDRSGSSVSSAGDVNGDGLDDLIIGAPNTDNGVINNTGTSYVVFGTTDTDTIELSKIENEEDDDGGFAIIGVDGADRSGGSVSSAGDVNGDGLDDLIIGAPEADPNGNFTSGSSYVVFGTTRSDNIDLVEIENGTGGFVINGAGEYDRSGASVSSAGDVNGDGLDDLIIGAPADKGIGSFTAGHIVGAPASFVVFGTTDTDTIELADLNLDEGFVINGISEGGNSGFSVSGAGDVNNDGFDDLIIGAPNADADDGSAANIGASYVIFGGQDIGTQTDGEELTGDANADALIGSAGADTLVGNGGADVLRGGAGDDVLAISDTDFAVINGGNGVDTLRFDAAITLDFTTLSDNKITGIEEIDLTADGGNSTVTLNLTDVLSLSDTSTLENPLYISGNSGDNVYFDDVSNGQDGTWRELDNGKEETTLATFELGDNSVLAHVLIDSDATIWGLS